MQSRGLLNEELKKLRTELSLMAARVEEDLNKSLVLLRSGGKELAKEVRESGKLVDDLQVKIDDMALVIIATQQPVARDLRELVTVFKITSSLERIGNHGHHLVKSAVRLKSLPPFRSISKIEHMTELSLEMFKSAFSAYLSQDSASARKTASMDDIIDKEHKELTDEILILMKEKPDLVKSASRILRLSGRMERLADHITNICEGIIYMVEGKHERL